MEIYESVLTAGAIVAGVSIFTLGVTYLMPYLMDDIRNFSRKHEDSKKSKLEKTLTNNST